MREINAIITELCVIVAIVSLVCYIPRLWAWFGAFEKQERLVATRKRRIAIIIPARNESTVIKTLLNSLSRQTYDKAYFDAHVIVKDKNDPTVKIASEVKDFNCYSYVCDYQTKKGQALDYCLKAILKKDPDYYDSYLVLDADCLLDEKCLEELNNAMESDSHIIQVKKLVKNYLPGNEDMISKAAMCNGVIWTIIDELGNRYKSKHNITNMTIGTGIMFRSDVIKELDGWPYKETLTEDIELMYDCVLRKYKTFYYSYARMYMEEAVSLTMTNNRRNRWMTGVIDSKRLYNERLKALPKTEENIVNCYFTKSLWLTYSYIGALVFAAISNVVCAGYYYFFNRIENIHYMRNAVFFVFLIYASFFVMTAFCLMADGKNMPISLGKKIELLFMHPIFYMGYITIVAKALLNISSKEWVVIERESEFNEKGEEAERTL